MIIDEKEFFTGRDIFDIIIKDSETLGSINKVIDGEEKHLFCRLNYKHNGSDTATSSYIAGLVDKFGDLTGILIISSENKSQETFKRIYKITDRQMEIVNLLLSGASNSDMADKLGITKKTVETHVAHIYNRLGINNKIELHNIAVEYNLILRKGIL